MYMYTYSGHTLCHVCVQASICCTCKVHVQYLKFLRVLSGCVEIKYFSIIPFKFRKGILHMKYCTVQMYMYLYSTYMYMYVYLMYSTFHVIF
jgi:hypothetical protein